MKHYMLGALLLGFGCGDKGKDNDSLTPDDTQAQAPKTSSVGHAPTPTTSVVPAIPLTQVTLPYKTPTYSLKKKCLHPELFLMDTPVQAIEKTYAEACKQEFWGPASLDGSCRYRRYTKNAIYAAYGHTFKKEAWRNVFARASWYSPNPSFTPELLSEVAQRNIGVLAKGCRITAQQRANKRIAIRWLDTVFRRRPKDFAALTRFPLPTSHCDDELVSTAEEAIECLAGIENEMVEKGAAKSAKRFDVVYKDADPDVILIIHQAIDVGCMAGIDGDGEATDEDCGSGSPGYLLTIKNDKVVRTTYREGSACPFVYTGPAHAETYRGEILRNLRLPSAYATQSLSIPVALNQSSLRVRIAEEKDETTYLDDVYVVAGTVVLRAAETPQSLLAADQNFSVLQQGESHVFTFALPPGISSVKLFATGYYVPENLRASAKQRAAP